MSSTWHMLSCPSSPLVTSRPSIPSSRPAPSFPLLSSPFPSPPLLSSPLLSSQRMTALVGWAGTTSFSEDWVFDQAAATYALDPAMAAKLKKNNPQVRHCLTSIQDARSLACCIRCSAPAQLPAVPSTLPWRPSSGGTTRRRHFLTSIYHAVHQLPAVPWTLM